jgi:uncharacterized protein (DUF433 family)
VILPDFLTEDSDGEVRLAGHRIGLYTVVRLYDEGCSAEAIAEELPSPPPELVRRVIAFYLAHPKQVEPYTEAYRAELERQAAAAPGPGVLRVRHLLDALRAADARHADDPAWVGLPVEEKLRRLESER